MGYESRLYVVDKSNIKTEIDGRKMVYGEAIAVFYLCVVDQVVAKLVDYKETDAYIRGEDGEMILKDLYGKALKEIPIPDMIKILEEAARQDTYRRYTPCIQMLKGFDLSRWNKLVVLHYGY